MALNIIYLSFFYKKESKEVVASVTTHYITKEKKNPKHLVFCAMYFYDNKMHVGLKNAEKIQMITDQCGIRILEENMMSLTEKCLIEHPGVYPTVRHLFLPS